MKRDKKHTHKQRRFLFVFLSFLMAVSVAGFFTAPANAQSLDEYRASGAIGEAYDGFARARQSTAGAKSTVDSVNAKRRSIYTKRAAEQKASPKQIGEIYAEQIINKAPSGTWILNQSGSWAQK
jgi:uncharacterized protein